MHSLPDAGRDEQLRFEPVLVAREERERAVEAFRCAQVLQRAGDTSSGVDRREAGAMALELRRMSDRGARCSRTTFT